MSRSLGNLITVEDLLKEHEADAFRLLVLNSGYRNPLTFTDEVITQAEHALERLRGAFKPGSGSAGGGGLSEKAAEARRGFEAAMDDDFNTAGALSQLFELVRAINQARDQDASSDALQAGQTTLRELAGILGLQLEAKGLENREAGRLLDLLVEIRDELRRARQWELADRIRDRLAEQGISLEDGPGGTRWVVSP
jgi:cysteinyl-tRNA synthetase